MFGTACARTNIAIELVNQEPFLESVRAINRIHEQCQQLSSEVRPGASRAAARSVLLLSHETLPLNVPSSGQAQTTIITAPQ